MMQFGTSGLSRLLLFLAMCLTALSGRPALAAKTDILILKNGDRITGEVKKLERGKLRYSTDSMGTIYVEWKDVRTLVSNEYHRLRLTTGEIYYGVMDDSGGPGTLTVPGERGTEALALLDFVDITPVEDGWWDRSDLTVGAGYSYAKASDITKANVYADYQYVGEKIVVQGALRSDISDDGDDTSTSTRATGTYQRFRTNRNFNFLLGQAEQNDELDIDLRLLFGGGMGKRFIENNRRSLGAGVGLGVSREESGDGTSDTNLEGILTASYDSFLFDTPKLDLSSELFVFPSITDAGRIRGQYEITLSKEIIEDFNWDMSWSGSFDTDPSSDDASKSDYTLSTGLSYEF